jgi:hypothetical protein
LREEFIRKGTSAGKARILGWRDARVTEMSY